MPCATTYRTPAITSHRTIFLVMSFKGHLSPFTRNLRAWHSAIHDRNLHHFQTRPQHIHLWRAGAAGGGLACHQPVKAVVKIAAVAVQPLALEDLDQKAAIGCQ